MGKRGSDDFGEGCPPSALEFPSQIVVERTVGGRQGCQARVETVSAWLLDPWMVCGERASECFDRPSAFGDFGYDNASIQTAKN